MKKYINLALTLCMACSLVSINAQLGTGVFTDPTAVLSSALQGLKRLRDKDHDAFKDATTEPFKLSLAAMYDLLPVAHGNQVTRKENMRLLFRDLFGVFPEQVDLSRMTDFNNKITTCKAEKTSLTTQAREQLRRYEELTSKYETLESQRKKVTEDLGALRIALNDFNQAKTLLHQEVENLRVARAQGIDADIKQYEDSLANITLVYQDKADALQTVAKELGVAVATEESHLQDIIAGVL